MAKEPTKKKTTKKEEAPALPVIPTPKEAPQMPPPHRHRRCHNHQRNHGEILWENGVLFMDKEFNQENCMPLVRAIMEYNMMPKEQQPEVIHLYINSPVVW